VIQISKVCIGIQARSTSTRFPGKVHELIDGRSILDHVIDVCSKAAGYINRYTYNNQAIVKISILVPEGDEIAELYRKRVNVIEGDEHDVLSRYQKMAETHEADYIVRITADCPRIPEFIISKHIMIALKNHYDYFSNVHEGLRTAPDGFDCEVISRKALEWLSDNAKEPYDREHVTPLIRNKPQAWMTRGLCVGNNDLHHLKLSVDTREDFEAAARDQESVERINREALAVYGKGNVHHF
jgi:spore coat polysaccharide biosynthesis protein SpsF